MGIRLQFAAFLALMLWLVSPAALFADEHADSGGPQKDEGHRIVFEHEENLYYSTLDAYVSLTNAPIPTVQEEDELTIYRDMFLRSYLPRFLVFEASVNPMPVLGVALKKHAPDFYDSMELNSDLNMIQALTAGFEEPYALSIFLGDVVSFNRPGERGLPKNKGYMGYLVSVGNRHIKDNTLIDDDWVEVEWKIKGDKALKDVEQSWSFRLGAKYHGNTEITDALYVSLRRSNLDFNSSALSVIKNSAFEYTYDMDIRSLSPVQHKFYIEKKYPIKKYHSALTLAVGFIYDTGRKYSGELAEDQPQRFQLIIQPNIQF